MNRVSANSIKTLSIICLAIVLISGSVSAQSNFKIAPKTAVIKIFDQNMIHFLPDSADKYMTGRVKSLDNGRVISTSVDIPSFTSPVKITANVIVNPVPKDMLNVHDRWDRAGNFRLSVDGMPDIEIVKYITSYGGMTEYEMDVSHLAPLLQGNCTFKGFIDTWVSPAWKVDFSLTFEPLEDDLNPDWAYGLIFEESFNHKEMGNDGVEVEVSIPDDMEGVILNYLVSGHCTDGRDADEFVPKDNVIYVDDIPVYRFRPWRDDCRQFREINPYCAKWSAGYWSSDFSRSGWCPGDKVDPVEIDLTDHLTPGIHKVRFVIENIRPEDDDGHYGYWRVSSHLIGWKK